MDLLKIVRRRSFLSEVVYTVLNIALAIALVLVVYYTGSVWFGIALVLLSKWRIFAVRVRYWYANILSNLVDIIVSVSYVLLLFTFTQAGLNPGQELAVLGLATLLYSAWLLLLKPRSKRSFMVAQAGVAILLGTWALFTVTYNWPVTFTVLGMWLIGYSATRHILSTYDDETYSLLLGLFWGFVFAQIGWVSYHWAIAYTLPFTGGVLLPQVTILAILASFVAYKAYDSFAHHQKVRTADIILPLLFSVSAVLILLFVFNRVGIAT
jgi:hypothetical protein